MPSDTLIINMGAPDNQGPTQQAKPETPMPYVQATETRYYHMARPHAQMARKDGLVIHFPGGIHATDNVFTIQWLDNEVANRHPELSHATQEQIEQFRYAKNPEAFIREKTQGQIEAELTDKLAAMLTKKLAATGIEQEFTPEDLRNMLADATDEELPAGSEDNSAEKLSGVDARLAKLKGTAIVGEGVRLTGMTHTGNVPT